MANITTNSPFLADASRIADEVLAKVLAPPPPVEVELQKVIDDLTELLRVMRETRLGTAADSDLDCRG